MDTRTTDNLRELLGDRRPRRVYEIGSLNLNGSVRVLFRGAQYHGVDIVPGQGVDVVADGATYVPPFVPDCVVCCEVLEHTPKAPAIVKQMAEVVEPGGLVLVSCAGPSRGPHSAVDGGPLRPGEYYGGVGYDQLVAWMRAAGLADITVCLSCFPDGNPTATPDDAFDVYVAGTKPGTPTEVSYKPLTVVSKLTEISLEDMAQRVITSREKHGPMLQQYHEAWYNSEHTWHYTHFCGVGLMKCPNDLWIYQDLVATHRPKTIVETGTYQGASALWFAFLMEMMQIEGGRVLTVDIDDHRRCAHPRITFLGGDSTDPHLVDGIAQVVAEQDGPLLVCLDSDHSAEHVRRELELYAPLVKVGDWLVVEDTNIGWGDDGEHKGDRGAQGGLEDYLLAHQGEFAQDVLCERYLLTMNPGGWLRRVAPCTHG